jgi:hypothetical protein
MLGSESMAGSNPRTAIGQVTEITRLDVNGIYLSK